LIDRCIPRILANFGFSGIFANTHKITNPREHEPARGRALTPTPTYTDIHTHTHTQTHTQRERERERERESYMSYTAAKLLIPNRYIDLLLNANN